MTKIPKTPCYTTTNQWDIPLASAFTPNTAFKNSALKVIREFRPFTTSYLFSFLLFSHQVMSNSSLNPQTEACRLLCPSSYPGVHPNSCPSYQLSHLAISSSVALFSSCPPSFLASRSFPMSRRFTSGGQNTEASASASVLPKYIQGSFPLYYLVPHK